MTPKVFVIDKERKPLLPTHPARARKLLREGKAKVTRVVPFTIQLDKVIDSPVGSFVVGIFAVVIMTNLTLIISCAK